MRASLVLATLALLATAVPAANATHYGGLLCDIDDDLYQYCHVGPVHWVTGPGCAGVALKERADCVGLRELLA